MTFKKSISLCLAISVLMWGNSAIAGYEITVQQAKQGSEIYSKQCDDISDLCHVFMGITPPNSEDDLELDIGVFFNQNVAYIQFKSGWDYFFIDEEKKYFILPLEQGRANKILTIYERAEMAKNDPVNGVYHLPVVRPNLKELAQLNINIKLMEKP